MRIAISTESGRVSAHFGRCPSFTIIDVEKEKIISKDTISNPGHQPGAIPRFLHNKGAECIICGGMGSRAKGIFEEFGIQTIVGVDGAVDEVIEKVLNGVLEGGESLCEHGAGRGYGLDKEECEHHNDEH